MSCCVVLARPSDPVYAGTMIFIIIQATLETSFPVQSLTLDFLMINFYLLGPFLKSPAIPTWKETLMTIPLLFTRTLMESI